MRIKHCALAGALASCVLLSGCSSVGVKFGNSVWSGIIHRELNPVAEKLPAPNPPVTNYERRLTTEDERKNIISYVMAASGWRDPDSVKFSDIYIEPAKEYQGKLNYVCGQANGKNGFGAYAGPQIFFMTVTSDLSKHYVYRIDPSNGNTLVASIICRSLMGTTAN